MHGDLHEYAAAVEPVEEPGEPFTLLLAKVVDVDVGKEPPLFVAELEKGALTVDTDRIVDDEQRMDAHQVVDDALVDPGFGLFLEKWEHWGLLLALYRIASRRCQA